MVIDKKRQQLGMAFGTACNRLKKSVMFMLAQKCGMDICCKCFGQIATVDEFSVEHLQPWLNVDVNLFWDLTNVGFSHLKCNIGAARKVRVSKEHKRKAKAARMRKYYTTEKRRAKKFLTGW